MNTEISAFAYHDPQTDLTITLDEAWKDAGDVPYFTRKAIGRFLGYADPRVSISNLLERNEFIEEFSTVINLITVEGGIPKTRTIQVFNPIGFYLICMKANTDTAKTFQVALAHFLEDYRVGKLGAAPGAMETIMDFVRTQNMARLFDQARRRDTTGEYVRGLLDGLGFPKKRHPDDRLTDTVIHDDNPYPGWGAPFPPDEDSDY